MARSYADENFPLPVVQVLRQLGHDVLTIGEAGKAGHNGWRSDHEMEAAITPDLYTYLTTELTGFTTLYGKVLFLRESDSTVEFEPVNGRALYCPASKDIVLCLREQLYQHVVAHGLAVWDALTLEVTRFEIQEFEPFTAGAASESLAALREQFGTYFDQIGDVDDWVSAVRRGDT